MTLIPCEQRRSERQLRVTVGVTLTTDRLPPYTDSKKLSKHQMFFLATDCLIASPKDKLTARVHSSLFTDSYQK